MSTASESPFYHLELSELDRDLAAANTFLRERYGKDAGLLKTKRMRFKFKGVQIMQNYPNAFKSPEKALNCLVAHESYRANQK